jgi:hypothetical protein
MINITRDLNRVTFVAKQFNVIKTIRQLAFQCSQSKSSACKHGNFQPLAKVSNMNAFFTIFSSLKKHFPWGKALHPKKCTRHKQPQNMNSPAKVKQLNHFETVEDR